MARTLDRSKPYGKIFGFDPEGRRFEQDGAYFDGAGDEIASADGAAVDDAASGDVAPGDAPAAAPRGRGRAAAPQAASQVDAQLAQ